MFEAYSDQFCQDLESFLQARLEELAPGGLMALVFNVVPDVTAYSHITIGSETDLVGSCLMDMAKMVCLICKL